MVKAIAHGNVFLRGDHFVVSRPDLTGNKAAVSAVALKARAHVFKPKEHQGGERVLHFESNGYGNFSGYLHNGRLDLVNHVNAELAPAAKLLKKDVEKFGIEESCVVSVDSEVQKGTSSSTAFAVAVHAGLEAFSGRRMDKGSYFDDLIEIQRMIHGPRASGAEFMSSIFGGTHEFANVNGSPSFSKLPDQQYSVIVVGGGDEKGSTGTMVGQITDLYKHDVPSYQLLWELDAEFEKEFPSVYASGSATELGGLMMQSTRALRNLDTLNEKTNKKAGKFEKTVPIVTPRMEIIFQTAISAGARGYKPTGAGGPGGSSIVLVEDEDAMPVQRALQKKGFGAVLTRLGAEGVYLE